MSKKKWCERSPRDCARGERCGARVERKRRARRAGAPVKLGFITKFPVDFYFTLVEAAKAWDKATPGRRSCTRRARAAPTTPARSPRSRTWSRRASRASRSRRRARRSSPALDKAVKAGRQGRADGQRHPDLEEEVLRRRDEQLHGRHARRQVARAQAQGRRHARHPRGRARRAGARRPRQRDARRARRLKDKVKVVSKLETDCDQTKGAAAAQTLLTANPNLTAIYSACGPPGARRDPVDQERGHQAGRDHPRRLRRAAGRGRRDQGGHRERQRRAVPGEDRLARDRDALQRRAGQEGAEERRHRHRDRDAGEREVEPTTGLRRSRREGARHSPVGAARRAKEPDGPAATDQAIAKIKELIISGEFAPRSKLPKEQVLAQKLGLSRNSLREAVRALSLIGVLEPRVGDGTYVTSLEPEMLLTGMGFVSDLLDRVDDPRAAPGPADPRAGRRRGWRRPGSTRPTSPRSTGSSARWTTPNDAGVHRTPTRVPPHHRAGVRERDARVADPEPLERDDPSARSGGRSPSATRSR